MIFMPPKISENIEEYLEVLYKFGSRSDFVSTTTLSKELKIAPGSVTQMLKKLEDLGYIEYTPYKGAVLTDNGMKTSQKITRKHRILERFLKDVLKIKDENIHNQACEMEHSLSDEAERALCYMLNHPDTCPGNHLIPACDFDFNNCEDCLNTDLDIDDISIRKSNLLAISQLNCGDKGEIFFIRGTSESFGNVLSVGIAIGIKIEVVSLGDSRNNSSELIVIKLNDSLIEIDKSLANNIFVKVL